MAFSKEFIEIVKDRNSIEELVNRYVTLKRAGSNYNGLCPFHSEKTPSFTVFPSTQSYYCFGCGEGGDVIKFVMKLEGLDYPEAVEFLAKRAGLEIERDMTAKSIPSVGKDRVIEATREACRFFYASLSEQGGKIAREYIEKRELTTATVKHFGIGYSPNEWDALYRHLLSKGFTLEEMKSAFLVGVSKNGKPYDIFRNRLMFPVFDLSGNPVAFSARRLSEDDERKYVNTSDTPAFKKSKILFALNFAKNTEDGTLILCEGAVDAVMLHQAGITNACATLGTSITDDHARIIARIAKTVYLAYDIDNAGRSATDKAINKLTEVGVKTKIISLGTEAKDPDEYIKKYGAESFKKRLSESEGDSVYTINLIISRHPLDIAEERAAAAREICAFLAEKSSLTDIDIYASSAAEKLNIDKRMLIDDIMRIKKSKAKKDRAEFSKQTVSDSQGFSDKVNRDKARFSSAASIEEKILGIMLTHPDIAPTVCDILTSESFVTSFNAKIYSLFYESFKKGELPDITAGGGLSEPEISAVARMMALREEIDDNSEKVLRELVTKLARQKEIRDGEKMVESGDAEGLANYIETLRSKKKKE